MVISSMSNVGMLGLLGVIVSVSTIGLALLYAFKPRESLLVLMRPVSLAALFGALTSFTAGLATILIGISASGPFTDETWRRVAVGMAEALVTLLVAFGCLTIAWLLVALGLRRAGS